MKDFWNVLSDRRMLTKESWEAKKKQIVSLSDVFEQFKQASNVSPAMRKGLNNSFSVLPKMIDSLWSDYPEENLQVSS